MYEYAKKLLLFRDPGKKEWLIYFLAFIGLHIPAIYNFYHNNGVNNPYLHFAGALLNGRLSMPELKGVGDLISYQGNIYLPYPPLPALFVLPFVALFGQEHVNTVLVALVASCMNLYLLYSILKRSGVRDTLLPWLIFAFFFGSPYWFALFTTHSVYAFAQVFSVMFQLLFLNELFGRRRAYIAGLFIGCSFLCRQFTMVYLVFALYYLYQISGRDNRKTFYRQVTAIFAGFAIPAVVYLVYNFLRFGDPMDTGYAYIQYVDYAKARVEQFGVFSPKYLLFNLYSYFLKGFNIVFTGAGEMTLEDVDLWGTSLLAASPFVLFSLRGAKRPFPAAGAWITIAVILCGSLFYHNNGHEQVNAMRFTLDFFPIVLLLLATGLKEADEWVFRLLVGYSILLNLVAFTVHYMAQ